MAQVPSNLIPTRVSQLPEPESASAEGYLLYIYEGRTYRVRVGDLIAGTVPDNSITAAKLANSAVTAVKIAGGAVTGSKIANGTIVDNNIASGAVTSPKIATGAVTATQLGTSSVTSAKIAAGAVGTTQLGDSAITAQKLMNSAITPNAIATGAVINPKIATSAVTTAKIADGAVTPEKLSVSYARSGSNSDLTSITGIDYVNFDPVTPIPAHAEGLVFYDTTSHSLAYYNDDSQVTVNVGREQLIRVLNATGNHLVNGSLVYISGATGGWPMVTLAQANSSIASQSTIGVVTANIAPGDYGYVCTSGVVNQLDTTAYSAGTRLYLSAAVPGGWTSTRPQQPNYVVEVATVLESDGYNGKALVRIDKDVWFPNAEVVDTTTTVVLPTTPTVFKAPTLVAGEGFGYDPATGILTVNQSGSYAVAIQFNAIPSASNKSIYFYVEDSTDGGSTWNITRYSGRQLELANAVETQVNINAARYYPTGTKLRFYIWGDATVTLRTTDLPGTTPGTATKPAYRFLIA